MFNNLPNCCTVGYACRATLLASILCCGLACAAERVGSGRGLHKKIYAVPAPGKVKIDGKLDDWDLSGQLLMYVMQETSEMQSALSALMPLPIPGRLAPSWAATFLYTAS